MFFVFVYFGILLQGPWSEWEYKKLYKHKVAEHEEKRRQCQTCDNKKVAKHRVDAIVVNKDLTRVTKWENTTLWHMQTIQGTIKWRNIEAMRFLWLKAITKWRNTSLWHMQKMLVSTNYKVKKHRGDASQCGFCDFDDTCRQCEKVLNSNYEVRKHHVRTHASHFGFCD